MGATATMAEKIQDLDGRFRMGTFRVENYANDFKVLVGLRREKIGYYQFLKGTDFTVRERDAGFVSVPRGEYDVYFKYSNGDRVYEGDPVRIGVGTTTTVQIVKRADGNYNIRGL
jgi:hypothetical protein